MRDVGAHFWAQQHRRQWADDHNWEMALVIALERLGYSRDQSRRMAEMHRRGDLILLNDNGGPLLTGD